MRKDYVSEDVLNAVWRALPTVGGITPKQVHEQVRCWSRVVIYRALRELCDVRSATYTGPDHRRKYRRTNPGDGP